MYLVTKSLKCNKEKIAEDLLSAIKPIIAMDTSGTDAGKLRARIKDIEDKRARLVDIYLSGDIAKDEFSAGRSKCDVQIAELRSVIDSMDGQRAMIRQQKLMGEISGAISEIIGGVEYEDELYRRLLDKMVVNDKDNIDVYLKMLPMKWSYRIAETSKKR